VYEILTVSSFPPSMGIAPRFRYPNVPLPERTYFGRDARAEIPTRERSRSEIIAANLNLRMRYSCGHFWNVTTCVQLSSQASPAY
jgi:hypothetical protein